LTCIPRTAWVSVKPKQTLRMKNGASSISNSFLLAANLPSTAAVAEQVILRKVPMPPIATPAGVSVIQRQLTGPLPAPTEVVPAFRGARQVKTLVFPLSVFLIRRSASGDNFPYRWLLPIPPLKKHEVIVIGYEPSGKHGSDGFGSPVTAKDFSRAVSSPEQMIPSSARVVAMISTAVTTRFVPYHPHPRGASLNASNDPLNRGGRGPLVQ